MRTIEIELSKIQKHPLQPEDRREIADIVDSMASVGGVLSPPIVMQVHGDDEAYVILSGHRRIAAAKSTGEKTLLCQVRDPLDTEQQVRIMMAGNVQKELNPLQKSRMLVSLIRDEGLQFQTACEWMGIKTTEGRALARLEQAPEKVQELVKKGELAFGTFRRELAPLTNDAMLHALNIGTTRKAVKKAKREMERAEAGERMVDDSERVLAELTLARKALTNAASWLLGADTTAAAGVYEALRGVQEALDVALEVEHG